MPLKIRYQAGISLIISNDSNNILNYLLQIFLLLTGFIATGFSLPDEATTTPDPSVFEMETPPGFIRFFSLKDETMANPMNIKSWHMNYSYGTPNNKFPDWFHFSDVKPDLDIQVNKDTQKGDSKEPQKTEDVNKDWKQTLYEAFNLVDSPMIDTFNAKDVFPPYYNVFVSNAYPNWMAVPGFVNKITNNQEDKHEIDMKTEDLKAIKIDERIGEQLVSTEAPKLAEKEELKINHEAKEDNASELPQPDSLSLKVARNIDLKSQGKPYPIIFPDDINVKIVPEKIVEVQSTSTNNDKDLEGNTDSHETVTKVNVLTTDKVPVQVSENQDSFSQNIMSIPIITIKPSIEDKHIRTSKPMLNLQTPPNQMEVPIIIPHYSEEKPETVLEITDAELQEKASSDDDSNPMKNNFLYNLLMKIKLPNIEDIGKDPSKLTSEIPLNESPKPKDTDILSGNSVVINNADDLPTVEQNVNQAKPSPDIHKPPSTGSLPNVLQNLNLPTKPITQVNPQSITQPRTNQGNVPLNTFVRYSNGNNIQQPVLLTMPYNNNNNVPMNYVLTPLNVQQGIPNNGQMQANQPAYPSNNMMLVSPGMNSGNNMPLVNPGMNSISNMQLVNPGMNPGYNNIAPTNGMNSGNNNMLTNPGRSPGYNNMPSANGMNSGTNNMALMNPGMNSGQNMYTIVPLANVGSVGNMNTAPSPYLNSNQSPNGYQMGALPVYNLVPVNGNVLVNTKDEEESM